LKGHDITYVLLFQRYGISNGVLKVIPPRQAICWLPRAPHLQWSIESLPPGAHQRLASGCIQHLQWSIESVVVVVTGTAEIIVVCISNGVLKASKCRPRQSPKDPLAHLQWSIERSPAARR